MSDQGQGAAGGYLVLARKYRPRDFSQLIGQDAMVRTLTNAFKTNRIAQGYMLTGVRGVGKTTTARIIARGLNYQLPGAPGAPTIDMPELGEHCAAIMESRHVDVMEMDAASHTGIGDIREIIEAVRYKPVSARYKVYIIDEVHMLSTAAFNGLLKTLEEPPEHVKFIFATTEIRKVPITVLSRCQRFDLRRVDAGLLVAHLKDIAGKEGIKADDEALALIARAAEGSVRDALSIMDQAVAHASGTVAADAVRDMLGLADRGRVIDLFRAVMAGGVNDALGEFRSQYDAGADPVTILSDLAQFTHLVTRMKYVPQAALDLSLIEAERSHGKAFADELDVRSLSRAWQMLLKGIGETQAATRPLAAAEMVIVRLAHAASLPTPDEVIRQLQARRDDQPAARAGAAPAPAHGPAASAVRAVPSGAPAPSPAPQSALKAAPQSVPQAAPKSPSQPVSFMASAQADEDEFDDMDAPPPHEEAPQGWSGADGAEGFDGADDAGEAPDLAAAGLSADGFRRIASYDDIVAIAAQTRDVQLKFTLENSVRLIRFDAGRIEMAIEPGTDSNFAHQLSLKLKDWTGERWMIIVSAKGGGATIAEKRSAEREALLRAAEADPDVRRVLEHFPGATIVEVRENRLAGDDGIPVQQAADKD